MKPQQLILSSLLLLASCAKPLYVPVEHTRTITKTLHDTVVITKLEKETSHQTVKDTTSTVETKYATSTAIWHGTAGELSHSLTTKDTPFQVKVQYVERVIIDSVAVPYPIEVEKLIEKPTRMPLRWWENLFFYAGIVLLTTLTVLLIIKKTLSPHRNNVL